MTTLLTPVHADLFPLLAGIFAVLVLATTLGQALSLMRIGNPDVVENFNQRTTSWWIMGSIMGGALIVGKGAVILLFATLSFAALREVLTLTARSRGDHKALAASFFIVLPIQYISIWQNWFGFYAIFIPVYAFLGLAIIPVLFGSPQNALTRIAQTQWAVMISIYCVSHVPALLFLDIPEFGAERSFLLIAFLIVVVQSSDVLQYIWGHLLGRRAIAPAVSPNKTWEGFLGGIGSATLLGGALFWLTPFSPIVAAGIALVITTMGFFGGLVLSAIKRDRGVKDWGATIEGHGGFLDRLDSVVFAAPIFFHLTRFFWQSMAA